MAVTRTSPPARRARRRSLRLARGARRPRLAAVSPVGLHLLALLGELLRDELAQHHRHAALHRLEGLAREALVGLAQAPAQRDDQAHRDLRVFGHQPAHVGPEHGHHADRLDRLDGGRAQLVLEHRQLAEDVARAEGRERDRAPVAVLVDGARMALAHDVAGVAGVALAEHHLARLEPARHRQLGDPLEIALHERGEHGHAPEQLHHLR